MTDQATPAKVRLTDGLGPSVPQEVMTYLHAYGDSRADDDGLSGLRIGEAVLALRRWSADVQATERRRIDSALSRHSGLTLETLEYLDARIGA
ncbi:MAG: hypothetical protein KAY54_01785 [Burkholderiaceae bacterium]|nr:hypothetical protein [Burkholderiaceae bacterium]